MSMSDQSIDNGVNGAAKKTDEFMSKASDTAKRVFDQSKDRLSDAVDYTGQGLGQAQEFVSRQMQDRPLTAAAAAMGVGVLVGLLIAGRRS